MGGPRFGEAAAIRWEDHVHARPLTKICVTQSYNTRKRRVKETKTETPRDVPVHPELLRVLDWWKREGWQRLMGRPPRPDDLIVPSRRGKHRNANHMCRRLHEDLERLGLRKRNQHDFRRTFISIAQECGANVPLLKWITHGNTRATIMDDYSAISWEARCAEMLKVDVLGCAAKESPIEDGILNAVVAPTTTPVVELPPSSAGTATAVVELPPRSVQERSSPGTAIDVVKLPTTTVQARSSDASSSKANETHPPGILPALQGPESTRVKWRSGRDLNPATIECDEVLAPVAGRTAPRPSSCTSRRPWRRRRGRGPRAAARSSR
jgi:hypothetical protein